MIEKPRLIRLTAILTQLQSKYIITAREIADKHQVSIRTVYRDIRTLENSGVPITTQEGKGYSLVEGYNLPPVMFTETEANALITAEHLLIQNNDQSLANEFTSAILKIKSTLRHNQKEKLEYLSDKIFVRDSIQNSSHYLMTIQSALSNFYVIEINYVSEKEIVTTRAVEPFALYNTKNNWLLIAICNLRNDFRVFRLDRIQNLKVMNTVFEPQKLTLEQYFKICTEKQNNP